MEVDSGSDAPVLVGKHAAAALGLDPAIAKGQPATLQVAGGPRTQQTARVLDIIYDGNIGIPTLKDWIVTFDLAGERLAIAPVRQASQPRVGRLDQASGAGVAHEGHALLVHHIGPAQLALGIGEGAGAAPAGVAEGLAAGAPGGSWGRCA